MVYEEIQEEEQRKAMQEEERRLTIQAQIQDSVQLGRRGMNGQDPNKYYQGYLAGGQMNGNGKNDGSQEAGGNGRARRGRGDAIWEEDNEESPNRNRAKAQNLKNQQLQDAKNSRNNIPRPKSALKNAVNTKVTPGLKWQDSRKVQIGDELARDKREGKKSAREGYA